MREQARTRQQVKEVNEVILLIWTCIAQPCAYLQYVSRDDINIGHRQETMGNLSHSLDGHVPDLLQANSSE